jgi:hypothetical protein
MNGGKRKKGLVESAIFSQAGTIKTFAWWVAPGEIVD